MRSNFIAYEKSGVSCLLIKSDLEALGVPVAKAAGALGISRQHLYRVIKGECPVSADLAWRLEQAIGSTAEFWLSVQINYDVAQIRNSKSKPLVRKLAPRLPKAA
ncbi:MAG: HigA family addiction module antidote protein [Rhizobiales bacterium]|nr:HigA family addiction module antidote protein [Hyphomicrobiales bacterium]